ncbi:MAG: hypothetical protein GY778_13710 [bacterium]|nr:hypothetical protein [bacterium]
MKFRIIGAARETGAAVDLIIDAPTPSAAEEQANAMGVLIERIELDAPAAAPVASPQHDMPPPQQAPQVVQPVHYTIAPPAHQSVQTTQKTAKTWKALQLFGGLLIVGGCPTAIIGTSGTTPEIGAAGVVALLVGLVCYVGARIAAWWFHG